jgi:hypothetical protein
LNIRVISKGQKEKHGRSEERKKRDRNKWKGNLNKDRIRYFDYQKIVHLFGG